ncbi:unnamed protein product [Phaeothamnion confervicola]
MMPSHSDADEGDDLPPDLVLIAGEPSATAPAAGTIGVTIVTGFLGSGKTTLLNHILTQDHGRRIAVIENEFGDSMDIENLIARGAGGVKLAENLFELRNGCICCTVKDDLVTTLETLLEQRAKFDYVIIETTGLADPGPVAAVFWLDEALDSALRLDGIVTLVDAKNIMRHLHGAAAPAVSGDAASAADRGDGNDVGTSEHERDVAASSEEPQAVPGKQQQLAAADNSENGSFAKSVLNDPAAAALPPGRPTDAMLQIAYADRILLNKSDLVTPGQLAAVERAVRRVNGVAEIRRTRRAAVELDWVLDTRSFSVDAAAAVDRIGISHDRLTAGEATNFVKAGELSEGEYDAGLGSARAVAVSDRHGGCGGGGGSHGEHAAACSDCGWENGSGGGGGGGCTASSRCASHDLAVTTLAVQRAGSIDTARVDRWIGSLLWEKGGDGGGGGGGGDGCGSGGGGDDGGGASSGHDGSGCRGGGSSGGSGGGGSGGRNDSNGADPVADGSAGEIYRIKGVLNVAGSDRRYVLQGVHELFDLTPSLPWEDAAAAADAGAGGRGDGGGTARADAVETRLNKIVFIGKNLKKGLLQRGFDQCFVE